jgi:hypothetical protein
VEDGAAFAGRGWLFVCNAMSVNYFAKEAMLKRKASGFLMIYLEDGSDVPLLRSLVEFEALVINMALLTELGQVILRS